MKRLFVYTALLLATVTPFFGCGNDNEEGTHNILIFLGGDYASYTDRIRVVSTGSRGETLAESKCNEVGVFEVKLPMAVGDNKLYRVGDGLPAGMTTDNPDARWTHPLQMYGVDGGKITGTVDCISPPATALDITHIYYAYAADNFGLDGQGEQDGAMIRYASLRLNKGWNRYTAHCKYDYRGNLTEAVYDNGIPPAATWVYTHNW